MKNKTFSMQGGTCPSCESKHIKYTQHEFDAGNITFYGACEDCGTDILEEYSLVYNGTMNINTNEYFGDGEEVQLSKGKAN